VDKFAQLSCVINVAKWLMSIADGDCVSRFGADGGVVEGE